jgi:hypothetical protein
VRRWAQSLLVLPYLEAVARAAGFGDGQNCDGASGQALSGHEPGLDSPNMPVPRPVDASGTRHQWPVGLGVRPARNGHDDSLAVGLWPVWRVRFAVMPSSVQV